MNLNEGDKPLYMGTVTKNGELSLVLLQTHPRQMILSKSLPLTSEEIADLAKKLYEDYPNIPGSIGESTLVTSLAEQIARLKHSDVHIHMKQRIYVLTEVKKPASASGKLRQAEMNDFATMKEWIYHFCQDVGEPISVEEAVQKAEEMIEKKRLYVWDIDGKLVSMACWARPTKTNVTVGFVYTPPKERKKGYASDCVAALTQHLLDSGYNTVSLYTDLANPTSNKIYMEIGYEPVMDSMVVLFRKELC